MRLTIKEAAKKWHITENTVMGYISKGWIEDIQSDNNIITLPDIPKPYQKHNSPKLTTQENIYKFILQACNNGEYISAFMLGISQEDFERAVDILKDEGLVKKGKNASKFSNIGYSITTKGISFINDRKFIINIDKIIEANFEAKIGLMNIG